MKKILFIIALTLSSPFISPGVEARRGCCSHHGGVCGCRCCDGSSLSTKCSPYYPSCNPVPTVTLTKTISAPITRQTTTYQTPIKIECPNNAFLSNNKCVCNSGYTFSVSGKTCITLPRNAHSVKSSTEAWQCNDGFKEEGNSCIEIKIEKETIVPVVEIVDGDTIKVQRDNETETIRIIGIDTPETRDPRYPVQCFGEEATQRTKEILEGKTITLVTKEERGTYGRLLAYIHVDSHDFGEQLIQEGYAFHYRKYPHDRMSRYDEAEKHARDNDMGLWNESACNGEKKAKELPVEIIEPDPAEETLIIEVRDDFFDDFIEAQPLSEEAKEVLKEELQKPVVKEEKEKKNHHIITEEEEQKEASSWTEIFIWINSLFK